MIYIMQLLQMQRLPEAGDAGGDADQRCRLRLVPRCVALPESQIFSMIDCILEMLCFIKTSGWRYVLDF